MQRKVARGRPGRGQAVVRRGRQRVYLPRAQGGAEAYDQSAARRLSPHQTRSRLDHAACWPRGGDRAAGAGSGRRSIARPRHRSAAAGSPGRVRADAAPGPAGGRRCGRGGPDTDSPWPRAGDAFAAGRATGSVAGLAGPGHAGAAADRPGGHALLLRRLRGLCRQHPPVPV